LAILVGIDEAGYGPLLGPLLVSSVALEIPDELLRNDLWKLLSSAVAPTKKNLAGRLLITDSKKAYTRSTGIGHLQRSVLASLLNLDRCKDLPASLSELLTVLNCPSIDRLRQYDWYNDYCDQPLLPDDSALKIAANVLGFSLRKQNIRLLDISARCLDVQYFNKMVTATNNKANVLFTAICELITHCCKITYTPNAPRTIQFIIDRQGGRCNYTPSLRKMFPSLDLRVIRQDNAVSSYELSNDRTTIRLHFAVKADLNHLPVALASMTAKFLRELMMNAVNAWFARHCANLKPTAGYWQDGQRFINDLRTHFPHLTYDADKLIRLR
jgi:ribonuclease HII